MKTKACRLPALDGVRAISILLVLFCHSVIYIRRLSGSMAMAIGHESGRLGVSLFFVLSGFLITRTLISVERPDLRSFYADRVWRIVPACYAYLLAIFALGSAGLLVTYPADFAGGFTFTRNFWGRGEQTSHLWSIAVEAHFYAAWALLVSRFPRRVGLMAIAGFLLSLAARYVGYHDFGHTEANGKLYAWTCYRLESVLAGSLLAVARHRGWRSSLATSFGWAAPLGIAGWLALKRMTPDGEVWAGPAIALLLVMFAAWAIEAEGPVAWILGCRLARWIAVLSYSLYLWQQLFLARPDAESFHALYPAWAALPLTLAAAIASYLLVERPALAWRKTHRPERPTTRQADGTLSRPAAAIIDCVFVSLMLLGLAALVVKVSPKVGYARLPTEYRVQLARAL